MKIILDKLISRLVISAGFISASLALPSAFIVDSSIILLISSDFILGYLMLFIGYILDNLVMVLRNNVGFVIVFWAVMYLEYLVGKAIIRDESTVKLIKYLNSYKIHRARKYLQNENICINETLDNIGMIIGGAKNRMPDSFFSSAHVMYKADIHRPRLYCHKAFFRNKKQMV